MSRFDDFAKSRAEGRGLASALKRTRARAGAGARAGTESEGSAGVSRRDLMKKAGLVTGATVVGSTLIQSVTAPAFGAVSPGCFDPGNNCGGPVCAPCPNGAMCATTSDCASGYCSNHICVAQDPISDGSPCTGTTSLQRDFSCRSEYCDDAGNCAERPYGTVPNGSRCHGVTEYQATVQCADGEHGTCSGWTAVTAEGTCRRKSGASCTTAGQDVTCASGICFGGKCV